MEANPFATTLCIAVERLPMREVQEQRLNEELQRLRMSYWEYVVEGIRADIHRLGIDLDTVSVEVNEDRDEIRQRYISIAGVPNDQTFSVKAIIGQHCTVIDDDFNPVNYEDDPEDTWWRDDEE